MKITRKHGAVGKIEAYARIDAGQLTFDDQFTTDERVEQYITKMFEDGVNDQYVIAQNANIIEGLLHSSKRMASRFPGTCALTGCDFDAGTEIIYGYSAKPHDILPGATKKVAVIAKVFDSAITKG